MAIAQQVATRSTCDRKHVGAVIVRDRMILTTGYNGSIRGLPHCDDVGHLLETAWRVRPSSIPSLDCRVRRFAVGR